MCLNACPGRHRRLLQHGGYDRHLRKLRYALEGQQANMLAAIARYFPAQTRVSHLRGYFLWLELPEQMDALKLFHMALAQASASPRADLFAHPTRQLHSPELRQPWNAAAEQAMETLGRIIRSF